MSRWCQIRDGQIVWGPGALPRNHDNTSNFNLLPEAELRARGWRPHRFIATATEGQVITGSVTEITETEVIETQTARDPTPEELAERARADVPASVHLWRLRAACRQAGHFAAIEAAIAAMPEPTASIAHEAWEYGHEIERASTLLAQLAAAVPLTQQQVDDLFRAAAAIQA